MRRIVATIFSFLVVAAAHAQSTMVQGGPWTPGHAPMYVPPAYGTPVLTDSGPAGGGGNGVGLSEQLLTERGTGTPPYVNAGTGPLGTNWCDYDAPVTNATGYHYLCLGPNAQGGGLIAYGAGGAASQLPLQVEINGVKYPFPGTGSGNVLGPTSTVIGDLAVWNNTAGTLLKDVPYNSTFSIDGSGKLGVNQATGGAFLSSIAALRAETSTQPFTSAIVSSYYGNNAGGGGLYIINPSDTTSSDNGGTIIVDASSRRWYLQYSGSVDIKQFGAKVDGTTDDSTVINNAIIVSGAEGFTLTANGPGTSNIGSTTISFPRTLPSAFAFNANPAFNLEYSGSGDAVNVNSQTSCNLKFGGIIAPATSDGVGLHLQPNGNSTTNQNAFVACEVYFNQIIGFRTGIYEDANTGNIAALRITGMLVQGGAINSGTVYGLLSGGTDPHISQGNQAYINYMTAGATGSTWIGIQDGSAEFSSNDDSGNFFTYAAIDGTNNTLTTGVVVDNAIDETFNGTLEDGTLCFKINGASYYDVFQGHCTILSGATTLEDNSTVTTSGEWHWRWLDAGPGQIGNAASAVGTTTAGPMVACVIDGTAGTIIQSTANCGTLTKNGTGDYTLNYAQAIYWSGIPMLSVGGIGIASIYGQTSTYLRFQTYNLSGSLTDYNYISVMLFGGT